MPTYDGSKITTGTLYENGTIRVKNGFTINEDPGILKTCTLNSSKQKQAIIVKTLEEEKDIPITNNLTLNSSKQKQAILVKTLEEEKEVGAIIGLTIISSKQKKVIIVP